MEAGWFQQYLRHLPGRAAAEGLPGRYREFHGGHHAQNWRGSLMDGLVVPFGVR